MSREQRAPGFAFARMLRDQEFRRYLKQSGYTSGTTVVALGPDDVWEPDLYLQTLDDQDGDVLVAQQDDAAVHGWRLTWAGGFR